MKLDNGPKCDAMPPLELHVALDVFLARTGRRLHAEYPRAGLRPAKRLRIYAPRLLYVLHAIVLNRYTPPTCLPS